ncbi:MAG: hypothetical protein ACREFP_27350 [Acetobacteraceae bacterium]
MVAEALLATLASRPLRGTASREQRRATVTSEKPAWESELGRWTQETDDFIRAVSGGAAAMHPRQMPGADERGLARAEGLSGTSPISHDDLQHLSLRDHSSHTKPT